MPLPVQNSTATDAVLFGHDPTPRLVALHPLRQGNGADQALMRVYQRGEPDGGLAVADVPYYPFLFLTDLQALRGFPRQRFRCQTLQGRHAYRYLVVFDTWSAYHDAVRHLQAQEDARVYRIANPTQQYLMQSGRTLFKDMAFDDLHRMQLDIEVVSKPGTFPHAQRPEDRIVIIALSDNRGWHEIIDARGLSEKEMLEQLVRTIRERDPDIIEGHNIYAFDLAYITARCARHGVAFAVGRDGSTPRTFGAAMRFAERSVDLPAMDIAGRHVIDTYLQVMAFDVFKRDLPGYGLKAAARYFGLQADDRTYVKGEEISQTWYSEPERLIDYARHDVVETERLARLLSGSAFYLTRMVPMPYGQVARTGPAAKIEALMVRAYLRQKQSLPSGSGVGSHMRGGYVNIFATGVVGPIIYADVESLYPSIMLNYDVHPETDDLGLFQVLLQRLTDLRLDAKRRMRAATRRADASALDAQQSSYKILINSFYGQLGFSVALFNDFAAADRVARIGQEIIRQVMDAIRAGGGRVVEVDTDGVLFVPPASVEGEEAERAFVDAINQQIPPGIRLGYDGRFRRMLSYKVKNYALLTYDDRVRCKGSSLVSRAMEPFGRRFVLGAIGLLLAEDVQGLHDLYVATRARLLRHEWNVEDFARTETLKENEAQYLADVAAKRRSRAAAYELAIARARETGQAVRKGEQIAYYVTGSGAHVTAFDNARLASAWDPAQPDENTDYYLRRLDESARKFAVFFRADDFARVFSPDDLFGFTPHGRELQTNWRAAESRTDASIPV
jgi:DNA polymerase elongation subunit (family B)